MWLLIIVLLLVVALFGVGWYFSNEILVPAPYAHKPEFRILSAAPDGTLLLPLPIQTHHGNTAKEGVFGLLWENGYGTLGEVLETRSDGIVRQVTVRGGNPPQSNEQARMDEMVFRSDPLTAHGISYETLNLQGPVGNVRAWWVDNNSDTAVVILHGRRWGRLFETLRVLPVPVNMGYSVLASSYRNHDESADAPNGFFGYGATEWEDVMVGLEFLRSQGVERVVFVGISMGAAVALETMRALQAMPNPPVQPLGLIMDSPLLDPRTVFQAGARKMGVPLANPLTDFALWIASFRTGIDWNAIDQRRHIADVQVPMLLIHGTGDTTVPVTLSDDLARLATVPVQYERIEGVEHVEVWNTMPKAYEGWVRDFLALRAPLGTPVGQTGQ